MTQEVRGKVNLAQRRLPDEIEAPIIRKQDPNSSPVLGFAISGAASEREITEYADKIFRPQIESADGVGAFIIAGARLRQINIVPDPYKMRAYSLSVNDLITALERGNRDTDRVPSTKRQLLFAQPINRAAVHAKQN